MLSTIHHAIAELLRTGDAAIGPDEAQVLFRAPERGWPAGLEQPVILFYLLELRENCERRETAPRLSRGSERATRHAPPRQFDLRHLVVAFASEPATEYALLWRALALLQRHAADAECLRLPNDLTLPVRLDDPGELRALDLWAGLAVAPRPALVYTVTAPLDLALAQTLATVREAAVRFGELSPGTTLPEETRIHTTGAIAGVARGPHQYPLANLSLTRADGGPGATTDSAGRFVLRDVPAGPLDLLVSAPGRAPVARRLVIPADSYDLMIEEELT